MAGKTNNPSILLAVSIFVLAASLAYFAFELSRFVGRVPDMLGNIRVASDKMEPLLEEVSGVRDLIPPILTEVRESRKLIPAILDEVKHVREAIPPILTEVSKTREHLPSILASVDSVSGEMKAYRPIASDALVQLGEVRKELPATLDQAAGLIDKAGLAASDAGSGAVTGALGGLITAPFKLVGNFAKGVLRLTKDEAHNYTKEDLRLVQKHGKNLLASGKLNDSHKWENADTGKRFKVSLNKIYSKDNVPCRDLLLQAWSNSRLTVNKVIGVCLNDDGEWGHH